MVEYVDQIKELEKQISETKYNKKTQHAIGIMKAKIAKLKEKQEARSGGGGGGQGYTVSKSGDGTVILLGYPSVGKSSLLNELTDANSEVGAFAFTTLTVIPGTMKFKDAAIQILDVPGIVAGAASGRGRGKEVLSTMHSADLVLVILDALHPENFDSIIKEARDSHIRINEEKPDVKLKRTVKGGVDYAATLPLTKMDRKTVESILREFRFNNCQIVIRSDINSDQLIDVIEKNKKYVPGAVILNKVDLIDEEQLKEIKKKYPIDLCISTHEKINLDELKDLVYDKLNFMRIYTKEKGKPADMNEPLIIFRGSNVERVCMKLHKDFVSKFKFCRVWGESAKFPGQKLALKHVLKDKDIVEIHTR